MDRRSFIRSLAAALPAGAAATKVKAETDPVKAAFTALMDMLDRTAPEGMTIHRSLFFVDGNLIASAYPPGWEEGQNMGVYEARKGGWRIEI